MKSGASKGGPTGRAAINIQPSKDLRSRIKHYFEKIDQAAGRDAGAEAPLPDELLGMMRAEHIPFRSPQEARWIARWIYTGVPLDEGRHKTIMFARTPDNYHFSEYDPIRNGVYELTSTPFADEQDERNNAVRRIPVLVTVEPLYDFEDDSLG